MEKNIQRKLNNILFKGLMVLVFGIIGKVSWGQNIFSGEPVQVVGQMNAYSTATSSNSSYRRVSVSTGTPTDGRGQWVKTYNVQSSGGDFTPRNMTGGSSNGFLFISGPSSGGNCGGRYNNRWVFSGVGISSVDAVNGISQYSSTCTGIDMGLNMSTVGRYTFVFNDVGYTGTNAKFYVAYTLNAPVNVSRSSQTLNSNRSANVSITTNTTPSSGENVYIRYTTSADFSSSNSSVIVQASGSGTSWSATIPPATAASTVRYYIFTSTISLSALNSMIEIDKSLSVLNLDDNSGSNYTYSFNNPMTSVRTGDLNDPGTFGVSQIFDGVNVNIATGHTITCTANQTVGAISIASTGNLTVNANQTLQIAGGVTGLGTFNVNGLLQINSNGFTNIAPTYGSSSTLIYAASGFYGRGTEWSAITGAGYPNNVQINSGTTLNLGANSGTGTARQCAGNLTINSGGTLSMNESGAVMTAALTVRGNFTNNGTITLSGSSGGDLILFGNLDDNGTFTANQRAIFFDGSNTQTINSTTDPLDIDVMRVQKTGGEIVVGTNLLVDETNDPFQVTTPASVINLNGRNLTIGKAGTTSAISMVSGSSIKCNTSSSINIFGNGTLGTLRFDPSNNTLRNLTINSGTTRLVTLGNALNIVGGSTPGVVTVGSGSTLNTGGFLTLKSDASGTASIGNSAGTISGNVTVERYISSSGRRWRFLSSPVQSRTIANWRDQFAITGPGTLIGTTVGNLNSNGWHQTYNNITNATPNTTTSVRSYVEANSTSGNLNLGWADVTTGTALSAGQGFRAFIRGPISGVATQLGVNGNSTTQDALTLSLTGLINSGDITPPASSRTYGGVGRGWNLLGNPYPCAYNFNAHYDAAIGTEIANIDPTVYAYNSTAGTPGYVSYNASSNTSAGLTDGIIPSGAGFFIQATGTPTFVFKETYKTTVVPVSLHKTNISNVEFGIKYSKDTLQGDYMVVKMFDGATLNSELYDIKKLKNEDLNLSAYGEDTIQLTASCIPFIFGETRIKLNVEAAEVGSYKFDFTNMDNFDAGVSVTLLDKYTNKTTNVKANTLYTFEMGPNENQWGKNRFELILNGKATTGINNNIDGNSSITSTNLSVYPNPATDLLNINISNANFKNSEVVVYNISGAEVLKTNMAANNAQLNIESLSNGVYFVKVSNQNGFNKTVKFVK